MGDSKNNAEKQEHESSLQSINSVINLNLSSENIESDLLNENVFYGNDNFDFNNSFDIFDKSNETEKEEINWPDIDKDLSKEISTDKNDNLELDNLVNECVIEETISTQREEQIIWPDVKKDLLPDDHNSQSEKSLNIGSATKKRKFEDVAVQTETKEELKKFYIDSSCQTVNDFEEIYQENELLKKEIAVLKKQNISNSLNDTEKENKIWEKKCFGSI